MKNYEEEKKDVEEFISGTVKELSEDNKQKAFWIIQGMILGQPTDKKHLLTDVPQRSQSFKKE